MRSEMTNERRVQTLMRAMEITVPEKPELLPVSSVTFEMVVPFRVKFETTLLTLTVSDVVKHVSFRLTAGVALLRMLLSMRTRKFMTNLQSFRAFGRSARMSTPLNPDELLERIFTVVRVVEFIF